MNTPDTGEEWLRRLVDELARTPAADWPAAVRRFAAEAPSRLAEILETAALLAAEHAGDATRTPAEAADWTAVVEALAAEYPDHAADIRECAGLLTAVARGRRGGPPPAGERRLRPGDRLGPFTVTGFVAGGGMGEVYAAAQDGLDRVVALKVIRAGSAGPLARARFDRERLVLARLHQSNVVPVYYAGGDGDLQFYAMQYVPGVPLNRVVAAVSQRATTAAQTGRTPPLAEVVDSLLKEPPQAAPDPAAADPAPPAAPVRLSAGYFRSVAAALAQAADAVHHGHEKHVLHRDVKPSNLILDARGVCMVIDYGLARTAGPAPAAADDPVEDALTRGGVGTPQYMAPEQFAGKADPRSDVWGLGATLYELLTLRPAFPGGGWAEVERRVRADDPEPADRVVPGVPKDLAAVCRVALAKNPAARYPTAAAFAADLRRWLDWRPTVARPGWGTLRPPRLWAWRHKGWAAAVVLAAAALVAVAVAAAAWADREHQAREHADAAAGDERRAREFAAVLSEAGELRRRRPFAGWPDVVRAKLDAARRLRPDVSLADAYLDTLSGPDARRVRVHELPEKRDVKYTGFSSVAFGPGGGLVCGGFEWPAPARVDRTPGLLFDPDPTHDPRPAARAGSGPVAYPDADTPLQLILPSGGDRTLVLWNLASNRAVAELTLPAEPARLEELAAALAPDGRRAAAALTSIPDADGRRTGATVVWDVDPKGVAAPVKRAAWDRPATALAFSPDGRFVAAGSPDGTVTVRDAATGAEVAAMPGERAPVLSLAFGRNFRADATGAPPPTNPAAGFLLAGGHDSGTVVVWDLGRAARFSTLRGADHYVNALAFTPDGAGLVTAGHDTPVLWDVAGSQPVLDLPAAPLKYGSDPYLTAVAVSADGRRVAYAGTNQLGNRGRVQVFELDPDRGVNVYRGLTGNCRQTWLSPSAELVAGLSDNWQVAVWERAGGRLRWVWDVPRGFTTDNAALAFDEPAGAVYFSTGDTAIRLDVATGRRTGVWKLKPGLNDVLRVWPGRPPLSVRRERDGPAERGKPAPPRVIRGRELLPDGAVRELYAVPDTFGMIGRMSATAGGKYVIVHVHPNRPGERSVVLDADTGKVRPVLANPEYPVVEIGGVSADLTRVAAMVTLPDGRGALAVYRLPDGARLRLDPASSGRRPDDAGVLAVTQGGFEGRSGLTVFRVGDPRPLATFDPGHQPVSAPERISPDGRYVMWGREDGSARVADLTRAFERLAALTGR